MAWHLFHFNIHSGSVLKYKIYCKLYMISLKKCEDKCNYWVRTDFSCVVSFLNVSFHGFLSNSIILSSNHWQIREKLSLVSCHLNDYHHFIYDLSIRSDYICFILSLSSNTYLWFQWDQQSGILWFKWWLFFSLLMCSQVLIASIYPVKLVIIDLSRLFRFSFFL